jgi:hypothetical protein
VESSLLKIHVGPGQRGDLTDARPRQHRREQERLVESRLSLRDDLTRLGSRQDGRRVDLTQLGIDRQL